MLLNGKNNLATGFSHRVFPDVDIDKKTIHTIEHDKDIDAYVMQTFIVAAVYNVSVHFCA